MLKLVIGYLLYVTASKVFSISMIMYLQLADHGVVDCDY